MFTSTTCIPIFLLEASCIYNIPNDRPVLNQCMCGGTSREEAQNVVQETN